MAPVLEKCRDYLAHNLTSFSVADVAFLSVTNGSGCETAEGLPLGEETASGALIDACKLVHVARVAMTTSVQLKYYTFRIHAKNS